MYVRILVANPLLEFQVLLQIPNSKSKSKKSQTQKGRERRKKEKKVQVRQGSNRRQEIKKGNTQENAQISYRTLDNPKSVILTSQFSSSRMLPGLRS